MSAIVAHELTQRFGADVALDAVDLALDQGEHLAVLGDNGAGKTTLLRILATAARPTSGRLEIFGLDAVRERKALRAQIGFVAHSPGLYPALSATENLEFFCTLHDVDRKRVPEALDLVGLTRRRAPAGRHGCRVVSSSGWRSAAPCCTARGSLVLDEPDASLDSGGPDLLAKRDAREDGRAGHPRPRAGEPPVPANRRCCATAGRSGAGTRLRVVR